MPPSLFRHSTAVQESRCEFYEKAGPTTTTKSAGSVGLLGCRLHDSGLASLELAGKAYTIQLPFDMRGKATKDETAVRFLDQPLKVQHKPLACGLQTCQLGKIQDNVRVHVLLTEPPKIA
jgi:hypothetical protein